MMTQYIEFCTTIKTTQNIRRWLLHQVTGGSQPQREWGNVKGVNVILKTYVNDLEVK